MCPLCVTRQLGTPAQRAAAIAAAKAIDAAIDAIRAEVAANHKPGWEKPALDAFWAKIDAPDPAKQLVRDRMARLNGERRGGRKRDQNWVLADLTKFRDLMHAARRADFDNAIRFEPQTAIDLPAPLHHAVASPDLSTAYAGLWDGTVRAYDLATGKELWKAQLDGGSQLALTAGALYAGTTRGVLARLDPATGKAAWSKVISEAAAGR